jgi:ABC-type phosphate transport system substrate-binding protein
MQHRLAKLGLAGASALTLSLAFAAPALADYAPSANDVVGVGSDTLQYAGDFVADGSYTGSAGYNTAGNKYKVVNFDATPDANARLAYGNLGVGPNCAPGTGGTNGTGNQTTTHADAPCTLNPTIVLRAGTKPVQRPNGSGAGAKALAGDVANGTNYITYARASSCQDTSCSASNVLSASAFDVLKIGTDPLAMLTSGLSTPTHAPPLSIAELASIYKCNTTQWSQLDNGTTFTNLSTDTIIPIIPQVGSGTRSTFESDIGITDSQLGGCVKTGEENDPTAIAAQSNPADAIEPMSGGRLNLFDGDSGATGTSFGDGGYFQDPSCSLTASGSNTAGDCTSNPTITPDVNFVTSGATPDGSTAFDAPRGLYIYFRASAVDAAGGWQPGSTLNQIRTLFYNPCDAAVSGGAGNPNCVTIGGTQYGPGGQPFYAKSAGQADIAAAGINPTYVVSTSGANGL